jgi:hypothetical protein
MTARRPNSWEAIFVRLNAGEETAAISLDRELYGGGIAHPNGIVMVHLGGVDLVSSRPETDRRGRSTGSIRGHR